MDKKKKIIIGTSVGGASVLALGLGLGLGLGLKPSNNTELAAKYVAYRNELVKKQCEDLYNDFKNVWKPEYTDVIKSSITNPHENLDTNTDWWKGGWQPYKWPHQPKNGDLYVNSVLPANYVVSQNENSWTFKNTYLDIMQWKDSSTSENPDPVICFVNEDITINK